DIESQILSLSPLAISAPYRSALGYHIFRLESKEALEGEGLNRVKPQIRDILFREKFDARLDTWLKEIKQRAIIDVRLDGQLGKIVESEALGWQDSAVRCRSNLVVYQSEC